MRTQAWKTGLIASMLWLLAVAASAAETVQLLTYHLHPPFVNAPQQGLTYELAAFLNQRSAGEYEFVVRELPRNRLNQIIRRDGAWITLWSNPLWFGDNDQQKYRWIAVQADSNAVLSPQTRPVEYTSPEVLYGKRFGGMLGHRYVGIDDLVTAGKIERIDGRNERQNLRLVARERLDVTILPGSTTRYLLAEMKLQDAVHVSATPHSVYLRHFFTPPSRPDLAAFLESIDWQQDTAWRALRQSFGF
jgi:polar amino acid transport system substrate-binding protein